METSEIERRLKSARREIKRSRTTCTVLAVLLAVAVCAFAWSAISRAVIKSKYDAATEQQATTVEPTGSKETYDRTRLREMADEVASLTELMSRLYPDYMVYGDRDGEIAYREIDATMGLNEYDFSTLVTDEETGRKTYTLPDGTATLTGIDVSSYQGSIDWEKVKEDGISFAIVRAGSRGYESGTMFEDDNFIDNIKGANEAGVPVGVYFYSQAATTEEAVEEAQYIIESIAELDVSWPIVFDMEEENSSSSRTRELTATQKTDITLAFCDTVTQAGYKPMIYGNMRWFAENVELSRLVGIEKWFAQYFSRPYFPYEYGMWQYSASGKVDGISGSVDMNIAFKDYGAE